MLRLRPEATLQFVLRGRVDRDQVSGTVVSASDSDDDSDGDSDGDGSDYSESED